MCFFIWSFSYAIYPQNLIPKSIRFMQTGKHSVPKLVQSWVNNTQVNFAKNISVDVLRLHEC